MKIYNSYIALKINLQKPTRIRGIFSPAFTAKIQNLLLYWDYNQLSNEAIQKKRNFSFVVQFFLLWQNKQQLVFK